MAVADDGTSVHDETPGSSSVVFPSGVRFDGEEGLVAVDDGCCGEGGAGGFEVGGGNGCAFTGSTTMVVFSANANTDTRSK